MNLTWREMLRAIRNMLQFNLFWFAIGIACGMVVEAVWSILVK